MKQRPSHLFKFLQTLRQPIYFLDASATLLFCNRALEEWTGCEAEKLLGLKFRYHGPATRQKHEIIAASLAPPPEIFQGEPRQQLLIIDHITSQSRRYARFLPLTQQSSMPKGVLVLVDESEADVSAPLFWDSTTVNSAEQQDAAELHHTLLSFRQRQAGRYRWDRMIGSSPVMQRVRRLARLAVESSASVLIIGEKGTGKEHLAATIHAGQNVGTSTDLPGAFVSIDCRLLDQEWIASTVIAFRQRAKKDDSPKENSSRRHTLLLQNAEALPGTLFPLIADFQAANLSRQRIIATSTVLPSRWTNHPTLPVLLGTILLELPPLRERLDDLPLLAQMFLEDGNAKNAVQRAGFSSSALDLLASYPWPGNIGELERVITTIHDKGTTSLVGSQELPERLRHVFDAAASPKVQEDVLPIQLEEYLQKIERKLIQQALDRASGNKTKAAELLGISRPRLYRRMEWFGLLDAEEPN